MAFDMYSQENVSGAAKELYGRAKTRLESKAKQLFTRNTAERTMMRAGKIDTDIMNRAIESFGIQTIMQGSKLDEDMKDLRAQALKARNENDLNNYRILLQKRLYEQQLKTDAIAMKNAKIGDFLTAAVTGISALIAEWAGSKKGQAKLQSWFNPPQALGPEQPLR